MKRSSVDFSGADENDVEAAVKSYILEQFLPGTSPEALTASTLLIGGGVLDSLATMRLVAFMEDRFGIEILAHEVNAENLDTIDRIVRLVREKQSR